LRPRGRAVTRWRRHTRSRPLEGSGRCRAVAGAQPVHAAFASALMRTPDDAHT
jgi:hypothetical protein